MAASSNARSAPGSQNGTATQILDVAERLAQTRGYNGFSYADIADEIGITKASLHYHFRTKALLGSALLARYGEVFEGALAAITASGAPAPEQLRRYVHLYSTVLRGERMCLCGMLAAEYSSLPAPMQAEIRRFFDQNEVWLSATVEAGRAAGTLAFDGAPEEVARLLLGALEGAMLVARPYGDPARFEAAAQRLLAELIARAV